MIWNWHKKSQEHWREESETLWQRGFTRREIERLMRLRSTRVTREQAIKEYRRLKFVRWLVTNGRLTDQLA
ncbi:MAG: hypothetical protein E6I91_06375 [Chloroflexi bacterium]|nr:MAG: hypothetical protein E6I91_06375 [Chloroflexota bacterium]